MNIGDVSRRLGLPASAIRYYESEGLIEIQPRIGGRRNFDANAIEGLRFVQLAQSAGFTLSETRSLLEQHKLDPSATGLWRPLVQQKQKSIKQQIIALQKMDRVLDTLKQCHCMSIKQCVGAADASCQSDSSCSANDKPQ